MASKYYMYKRVEEPSYLKLPSLRVWLIIVSTILLMFISGIIEAKVLVEDHDHNDIPTNGSSDITNAEATKTDFSGTSLSITYTNSESTLTATLGKVQLRDGKGNPISRAGVEVVFTIAEGADVTFANGETRLKATTNADGRATALVEGKLSKASLKALYDHDLDFETPMFTALDDFRVSDMGVDGNAAFGATAPDIAYNSTDNEYLVVWSGDDNTGSLVDGENEIFGQLLDGNGAEIGTDFRISDMGTDGNAAFDATFPDIAYNSTANEYLVVWQGDDNTGSLVDGENEIFGQRLSAAGAEIGTNDFRISDMGADGNVGFDASFPGIAYNSTNNNYLVVWHGDDNTGTLVDGEDEIFGQRLSAAGAEIGTNDFRISDVGPDGNATYEANTPAVVFNSTDNEYLVVWFGQNDLPGLNNVEDEIYGQRLSATGAELGTNDFRISDSGPDGNPFFNATRPDVAYNTQDNEYLVTWQGEDDIAPLVLSENEIFGQRLNASGTELGTNDFRISDMGPNTDIDYLGLGAAVAYSSASNEYMVTWFGEDNTGTLVDGEFEVFGQRLDASGIELGDNDFRISNMGPDGSTLYRGVEQAIAFNTTNNEFMVTWQGDDNTGSLVDNEFEIYVQNQAFPPRLLSSTPADDATGVSQTDNLTLTFNENIAFGSGNIQVIDLTDGTGSFTIDVTSPGTVASISGKTLIINPVADLNGNTNYAIQVAAGAIESSVSGLGYAGISDNTTLNFTTIGDVSNPLLISSNPADNDTEVPVADNLTFTFNENIVFGTGNITIVDVTNGGNLLVIDAANPGASGASISGNILTIDPSSSLLNNNQYAIQFASTSIDDASGNSYAGISDNTTLNFFTFTTSPGGVDTNLVTWLKADAGVSSSGDNTDITSWLDQTANSDDLTPGASAPNFITSSANVNFNPYIDFSGDRLNGTNYGITVNEHFQLFFVYNLTFSGLSPTLWDWDGNGANERVSLFSSGISIQDGNSATANNLPAGEWRIAVANATPTITSLRISGLDQSDTGTRVGGFSGNGNIAISPRGRLDANIAEVIYFNTALNVGTNLQQIESYLALKYGITLSSDSDGDAIAFEAGEGDYLDSNGSVIWDASDNSGYHHNVAGIIRDDRSDVIQRQSSSVSSGAIVTIGLDDDTDGLEATNGDNPSNFSADRSALVWGHDNANLNGGEGSAAETEFDPAQVKSRLNREWKVSESGTVGTVTVQFDVSGLLGPDNMVGTSDESQIVLLVDADGDFSSGASVVSQSLVTASDGLVLFRVDLTDGVFFTLGSGELGALPITLLSFNATPRETDVLLEWETTSEENNQFFSVERSLDGRTFESIALLDGSGNSQVNQFYQYIDSQPLQGTNFYRLVDIDNNGNRNYSEIRGVDFMGQRQFIVAYPNPIESNNMLRIRGGDNELHDFRIVVRNLLGGIMLDQEKESSRYSEQTIDTQNWPSGVYMLLIYEHGQLVTNPIKVLK